jgi:hypothetical protein
MRIQRKRRTSKERRCSWHRCQSGSVAGGGVTIGENQMNKLHIHLLGKGLTSEVVHAYALAGHGCGGKTSIAL